MNVVYILKKINTPYICYSEYLCPICHIYSTLLTCLSTWTLDMSEYQSNSENVEVDEDEEWVKLDEDFNDEDWEII